MLQVAGGAHDRLNLSYLHHGVQAVRAQYPLFAHHGVQGAKLKLGGGINITQDAHNHVLVRVSLSLLGANTPLLQQALHKGVVGGDLLKHAVTQAVGARVTNMGHLNAVAINQQSRAGGPHTRQARVQRHQLIHDDIGIHNLISQVHPGITLKTCPVKRG